MWDEGSLRAVASTRHGVITRDQALALGVTNNEISRRMRIERIEQLHPGVYYLNATPPTWKTDVLAGVVAAGPDALASHRCAAVLWGFDGIYGQMIEATVPYTDSPEPEGVTLHRTRRPNPVAVVEGIPLTTPERTLLDLARRMPVPTMEKAVRSAIRDGITTVEKIKVEMSTAGGRGVGGTRRLRRVAEDVAYDQSDSPAEIDLRLIVDEALVPRPVQQLRIRLRTGANAYPDFAWPDRGRIVEVDGFDSHRDPIRFQLDLERQNQLMDLGWEVRRFAAADIRKRPDEVREELIRFVTRPFKPFQSLL